MEALMSKWSSLSPSVRRILAILLIVGAVAFVLSVVVPENSPRFREERRISEHILTDEDASKVTLQTLAAKIDAVKSDKAKLERQMDQLRSDIRKLASDSGPSKRVQSELADLRAKLKSQERLSVLLNSQLEDIKEGGVNIGGGASRAIPSGQGQAVDGGAGVPVLPVSPAMPDVPVGGMSPGAPQAGFEKPKQTKISKKSTLEITSDARKFFADAPVPTLGGGQAGIDGKSTRPLSPRVIVEANSATDHAKASEANNKVALQAEKLQAERMSRMRGEDPDEDEDTLILPAGSIIEAVVLAGMDAPTNLGTRKDPFPALMRFKKEAILPNRYSADIRECFLIASGYGDLSSERVMMRGETVSCVLEDGGIVESRMDSYAVGEDGKAGVRGRVVTKDGKLLANALMAGFADGLSKAFDVTAVPTLSTGNNASEQLQYQQIFSQSAMQSGVVGGIGTAMEKIAERYLELADQIFPVVELDAGRNVSFILTRKTSLKTNK